MPPQPHSPSTYSLEFHCMPTQTRTTRPTLHDAIEVGSDFVGGAEAMPVRPATPGPIVPGSDFAGGALPLTAEVEGASPTRSEPPDGIAPAGGGGRLATSRDPQLRERIILA
jgi:hypothetical protein